MIDTYMSYEEEDTCMSYASIYIANHCEQRSTPTRQLFLKSRVANVLLMCPTRQLFPKSLSV
jgi:hypothetical protein